MTPRLARKEYTDSPAELYLSERSGYSYAQSSPYQQSQALFGPVELLNEIFPGGEIAFKPEPIAWFSKLTEAARIKTYEFATLGSFEIAGSEMSKQSNNAVTAYPVSPTQAAKGERARASLRGGAL